MVQHAAGEFVSAGENVGVGESGWGATQHRRGGSPGQPAVGRCFRLFVCIGKVVSAGRKLGFGELPGTGRGTAGLLKRWELQLRGHEEQHQACCPVHPTPLSSSVLPTPPLCLCSGAAGGPGRPQPSSLYHAWQANPCASPGHLLACLPSCRASAVMQLVGHEDLRNGPPPERDHLIPEALKQVGRVGGGWLGRLGWFRVPRPSCGRLSIRTACWSATAS